MGSDSLTYITLPDDELSSNFENAIIMKNTSKNLEISSNIQKGVNQNFSEYLDVLIQNWIGLDDGLKYVDKTIPENPGRNVSFLLDFNQEPFVYHKDGEQTGLTLQALYYIGRLQNLSITIKETLSNDDLIPAIKNGSADRAVGLFLKSQLDDEEILKIDILMESETCYVIRYDHHAYSVDWGVVDEIDEALLMDSIEIGMIFGQHAISMKIFGFFSI